MTRIYLGLIFVFMILAANSQQAKMSWGNEEDDDLLFCRLLKGQNTDLIRVARQMNGSGFFKTRATPPALSLYNAKMQVQAKNLLPWETSEDANIEEMLSVNNKLILFGSIARLKQDIWEYFGLVVDNKSLKPLSPLANVAFFNAEHGSYDDGMAYKLSQDSSLVLAYAKSLYDKKKEHKYSVTVLKNDLTKLWNREIELPFKDDYVSVKNIIITNEGKVCIILKQFEKNIGKYHVRDIDGGMETPYTTKMLIYEDANSSPRELTIDLDGKFLNNIEMVKEYNNSLSLFGLWKQNNDGNIKGFCLMNYNKDTKAFDKPEIISFPESLLSQVYNDKQANEKSKESGLSDNFRLKKVLQRIDGTIDYIIEHEKVNEYLSFISYEHGDIIDIAVQPQKK